MKNTNKKLGVFIYAFILFAFVASIIFTAIRIYQAPMTLEVGAINQNIKSDYYLRLLQCILGLIGFFLPNIIERKLDIKIPNNMILIYIVFLYCAIILGEMRNFYYQVKHWDTILHTFSGGMLGSLGFSIVSLLNNSEKITMKLSPAFVSLFAFCFAVTLGVFWEVYEFTFDGILGINMQKFMLEDGTQLIGRAALFDTMKDLIVDMVGAFIVSLSGYFFMNKEKDWLKKRQFKKK